MMEKQSFEYVGTTVYQLEFDSWRKGKEQMRNRVWANVQGYRDTPVEELKATARLFAAAPDMADLLDDLINTLANYRLLQKRSNDPQESIPTDKLPSAIVIAKRISQLEQAVSVALNCLQGGNSTFATQILKEALK